MNLYFLRHGMAIDQKEWKKADSDRPLTKEGVKKMKKAAKGMHCLGAPIDWILTSPYRRAHDTALIAAKELKRKNHIKISRLLSPDGDSKALIRHLRLRYRSWESVMLVGHEPYLSQLISMLIAGLPESDLKLDKGGLAKLTSSSLIYGKCAQLEWLLTSKFLKKLS